MGKVKQTIDRNSKLSDKQKRFCEEYLIDFNGTQAAIRAGYSKKTAKEQSSRALTLVNVQEHIAFMQRQTSEKLNITKERVLNEYAKIAFSDIRNLFNEEGALVDITKLDDNSAGAVSSVKSSEEWGEDKHGNRIVVGNLKEVKVFDKIRALQDLGKHLGLFKEDNDQSKPVVNNIISLGEGVDPNAGASS